MQFRHYLFYNGVIGPESHRQTAECKTTAIKMLEATKARVT